MTKRTWRMLVGGMAGLIALAAPAVQAATFTATFTNSFGDGLWERNAHIGAANNPNDPSIPGNWSTQAFPNNGHAIVNPNTNTNVPGDNPLYDVVVGSNGCSLGFGIAVQTASIAAGVNLNIKPIGTLAIANGLLTNNGSIVVNSTAGPDTAKIRFDANGTLGGSGSVTLRSSGNSFDTADVDFQSSTVTQAATHTIRGRGTLLGAFGGATFINNGAIIGDDVIGSLQLVLSNNANKNNSLIKATNGGIVTVNGGTIDQTGGGTLLADANTSSIQFFGGSGSLPPKVIGGILATANGGIIGPGSGVNNGVTLQACTNNGTFQIPTNNFIIVTGTGLTNNGSIVVNPTGENGFTRVRFDASGTLGGTGDLRLRGFNSAFKVAHFDIHDVVVTNGVNHTIHGQGTILGDGTGSLVNNGTIAADDPTGNMQLDLATTPLFSNQNTGTIKATNGSTLGLFSGLINQSGGGVFLADGSGSVVQLGSGLGGPPVQIVGGTLGTANSGIVLSGSSVLAGNITNGGTLEIPTPGRALVTATTLTNNGTITLKGNESLLRFDQNNTPITGSGSIVLTNGAKMQISGGQAVTNGSGHTVKGNGTIQIDAGGSFTNNGIVAPGLSPGQITVAGDYTQGASGALTMEIGGRTAGTEYDQLVVSGKATLGGTLDITAINGFKPIVGDIYTLVSAGSFAGSFGTVNFNGFTGKIDTSSNGVTLTVTTTAGQLLNVATRMRVKTDPNQLIGGFIITGTDSKRVAVRATGPSLSRFFSGVLADPTLEVFQGSTLLASNDNWKDNDQANIEATGLAPTNDLESTIVRTFAPGAYTAVVRGKNGTSGIGLVEVYDLSKDSNSSLANIASRGFVDIDDNVMIGGFIIGRSSGSATRVVIRAIGPSLTAFGVDGALADPTLELRDANGSLLRENDNWKSVQQSEIEAAQLAPRDDRESAISASLSDGNYTAIVRGKGNTQGVGLVEIYLVP